VADAVDQDVVDHADVAALPEPAPEQQRTARETAW
jgi:hypothetical protein